ncbi:class I SAM-dependent DNA methyltransferase [Jhaorihella thermophila]
MSTKTPGLNDAYSLKSPEDSRRLYAEWAGDYDESFAAREDYQLHIHTARAFVAAGGQGPVLDVGAGTGLCGAVLCDLGVGPIDATDISGEMLTQAMRKDIYRDAIEADINEGIPVRRDSYSGIVSSGTFTHGHVGPEPIDELLRIARHGAQFALSINSDFFSARPGLRTSSVSSSGTTGSPISSCTRCGSMAIWPRGRTRTIPPISPCSRRPDQEFSCRKARIRSIARRMLSWLLA